MPVSSLCFSAVARALTDEARRRGLAAPSFRSPPRLSGASRTIRRLSAGQAVVAVQLRDRRPDEVVGDMVDGVLVANGLSLSGPHPHRAALWAAARAGLAERTAA